MNRRIPATPRRPQLNDLNGNGVIETFKAALAAIEDGNVVMGEGESLAVMFDDVLTFVNGIKKRLFETEDFMYKLLLKVQTHNQTHQIVTVPSSICKPSKQYKERSDSQAEELQTLKKEKRAYEKRSDNLRSQLSQLEEAIVDRDEQIDHLTDVVNMCKDVILEQEDIRITQDAKQNLIRAVSRTQSLKRPNRPLNRVEETLESDGNSFTDTFDHTGDLLDGPSETNVLEMSINRCAPTTAKRRRSKCHRRQSAEREQSKQEVADSFWTIKTPVKQPMKKQLDRPQSPNLATHNFARKRAVSIIGGSKCNHCGKKFSMSAVTFKCTVLGCNVQLHEDCRDAYRVPCSGEAQFNAKRNLSDYLSDPLATPKIPSFVYMAIHEVECRLHEEGIYRINGSQTQIQSLKRQFISGQTSSEELKKINDTNTICSAIKCFFREMIIEPILTRNALPSFIQAYENNDSNLTKELFHSLPPENRDTLAFLLFHFKNVVDRSHANRMTKEALAKARAAGPSIVGIISPEPNSQELLEASKYQEGVMKMLLSLPQGFFNGFLRSGETTQEGTLSSLATVSTIQESLDAFGESNRTCVENRRNLFHPPSSPSKPKRTSQMDPSTPFADKKRLFKRY